MLVSRLDQAGEYLKETADILGKCFAVLTDPERTRPMPVHLAADSAQALVISAMEIGAWETT